MRFWTLLLVTLILAGFAIAQEEKIESEALNLQSVRLDDAIRTLGKEAKINLVLPFELDKKVTIQNEKVVDPLKLLGIVCASHGYELVKHDDIYTVQEMKKKETKTETGEVSTTTTPSGMQTEEETAKPAGPISSNFQLTHVQVEQAESKVRALLSMQGKLEVNREANALYVTDLAANIQQVKEYVDFLNMDPDAAFQARMESRTFKINHIPAEIVEQNIGKMVSDKGKYVFDKTSMTLTVMERKEALDNIAQFITAADQAEPQLFIRCHFIEVNLSAGSKLSTDFEVKDMHFAGNVSGGSKGAGFNMVDGGLVDSANPSTILNDTAVFSVASVKNDISAYLVAKANRDNYRVLSSPNLLCYNKQKSSIDIVTELPYKQSTTTTDAGSTSTSSIEFKDVGIKMEVMPEIYSDGTVKLNLKPEVSEEKGSRVDGVPVIRKKTVESNVLVKDGQVVVIGGLLEDQVIKTRYKVPLLGDIPLLGFLFSREEQNMQKTELVIFLHVTLVNDSIIKNMSEQKWREQEDKFQKFDTEFEFYPHLKEKLDMQKLNPNYGQADMKASSVKEKVADNFGFATHK